MKTFRITASYVQFLTLDIQAEDEEQAWKIAYNADGGDYQRDGEDGWQIERLEEVV